jgi:16S rRNA (cytosine967-C5)-methyltransferase
MAQLSARRAALATLRKWRSQTRFADSIISRLLADTRLSNSDRGFALELSYGVLRNLSLLDFWIDCLRTSPVDVDLRDVLRLGFYQLFCLKTPQHAAVYETVALARPSGRALVNGVLRAATRQEDELRRRAKAQPIFVRMSHPQFLVARWQRNFGAKEAEQLCAWNNEPPKVYGRINRIKIEQEEFLRRYPHSKLLASEPGFVEFDLFPAKALERGHCYIQDPSTAIACQLVDPRPGEKILDVCAAPGGKTNYLAELMKNQGMIVACDREPARVRVLQENIGRLDVDIAQTIRCDWEENSAAGEIAGLGPFDRILVDAPCSNTGVMRRRVDVRWRLQPADFIHMQKRQLAILRAVVPLLKSGATLVYSTCSLEPEENEEVIRRLLGEMSILQLKEEKHCLPFRDGFDGAFAARLLSIA